MFKQFPALDSLRYVLADSFARHAGNLISSIRAGRFPHSDRTG